MATKEKPKAKSKNNPKPIPSERKKRVLNELVANRGTMKSAMIKAGYSPQYAKNPKQFRETATWQQLLDANLPDWLLAETHTELLDSKDKNVQLRAVDLGYKIKGKHTPEQIEVIKKYEDLPYKELKKL